MSTAGYREQDGQRGEDQRGVPEQAEAKSEEGRGQDLDGAASPVAYFVAARVWQHVVSPLTVAWYDHSKQQHASAALSRNYGAIARLTAVLAGVRSGDGPLVCTCPPSALKRDCDRRATRQRWKVPGECTREVRLDPGGLRGQARRIPLSQPAVAMLT